MMGGELRLLPAGVGTVEPLADPSDCSEPSPTKVATRTSQLILRIVDGFVNSAGLAPRLAP